MEADLVVVHLILAVGLAGVELAVDVSGDIPYLVRVVSLLEFVEVFGHGEALADHAIFVDQLEAE